jgi:hypothetical protein
MLRFLFTFCLGAVVLFPAHAARSTIYTQAPYSIIQPTSTDTFAPGA